MASKDTNSSHDVADGDINYTTMLDGCRAGERESRRQLYELCHRRVYRLMVRMVGLQDAADLTQQAFLQIFCKIDQFAARSKFETWMYRLAVNEALQHLRKRQRWKFQTLVSEPLGRNGPENDQSERKELLDLALAQIEPELRSVFVLREVEGLSYQEISEAVDIPAGTVGSRLNRARRELQQCLIELGWEA